MIYVVLWKHLSMNSEQWLFCSGWGGVLGGTQVLGPLPRAFYFRNVKQSLVKIIWAFDCPEKQPVTGGFEDSSIIIRVQYVLLGDEENVHHLPTCSCRSKRVQYSLV